MNVFLVLLPSTIKDDNQRHLPHESPRLPDGHATLPS